MRSVAWLLLMVCVMLAACQQSRDMPADEAKAFADSVEPAVENMLVGFSNNDLEAHSRDFDQAMLDTVDESTFPQIHDTVIGKLGKYQTHTLLGVQIQNDKYVVVRYTAVFDNDPEVIVRVVFNRGDPDHKITGLWFDSDLLK
jgi:hypothetical protein